MKIVVIGFSALALTGCMSAGPAVVEYAPARVAYVAPAPVTYIAPDPAQGLAPIAYVADPAGFRPVSVTTQIVPTESSFAALEAPPSGPIADPDFAETEALAPVDEPLTTGCSELVVC